jgi:hypothetical protein
MRLLKCIYPFLSTSRQLEGQNEKILPVLAVDPMYDRRSVLRLAIDRANAETPDACVERSSITIFRH